MSASQCPGATDIESIALAERVAFREFRLKCVDGDDQKLARIFELWVAAKRALVNRSGPLSFDELCRLERSAWQVLRCRVRDDPDDPALFEAWEKWQDARRAHIAARPARGE